MKKTIILLFVVSLVFYGLSAKSKTTNSLITPQQIDQIISQMSIEEKVGQMMIVGHNGTTITPRIKRLISEKYIGGVALFAKNEESPEQLQKLCNDLQDLVVESPQSPLNKGGIRGDSSTVRAGNNPLTERRRIPLFIATDHEPGYWMQMRKSATIFPNNVVIGAKKDTIYAYKTAEIMAIELKALGINMNLAPVVDVNNNPKNPIIGVRSFGANPDLVSKMGVAFINGLQNNGIIATAKHFPGHGDTHTDSHKSLPVITHDLEHLKNVELKPFQSAIDAGVDVIMTAHILFPAIDNEYPATLSNKILVGLLREEMGFDGVIISDDFSMGALAKNYDLKKAVVMAVNAGVDIILSVQFLQGLPEAEELHSALLESAKNGEISEERLNEANKRIIYLKLKRNIGGKVDISELKKLRKQSSLEFARRLENKE